MKLIFPWPKKQLINTGRELAALRLWEEFENTDVFVVETPIEGPVVVAIMGAAGQEFGVSVFRGTNVFERVISALKNFKPDINVTNYIGMNMVYYRDMDRQEKKWYQSCDYRANKSDWLPSFVIAKPGSDQHFFEDSHDINLMLYVLKGIILASKDKLFDSITFGGKGGKILTITASGPSENPQIAVSRKLFPGSAKMIQFINKSEYADVPGLADISDLPRLNETWILTADYKHLTGAVLADCVLLIADESGKLIFIDIIPENTFQPIDSLMNAFEGINPFNKKGVPRKIIFADAELFNQMNSAVSRCGIKTELNEGHPVAVDIHNNLDLFLEQVKNSSEYKTMKRENLAIVPDDNDLDRWRLIRDNVVCRMIDYWEQADEIRTSAVSKNYFGDSNWKYYLDTYEKMYVLPSYAVCTYLSHRQKNQVNKPLHIDAILAQNLSEPECLYIEAVKESYPCLYRVIKCDRETILLENMFTSKQCKVNERELAKMVCAEDVLVQRLYSIGAFIIPEAAGPIFAPEDETEVINLLKNLGMPDCPSVDWLRQNAHLFGRLWKLYDQIITRSDIPDIIDSDGNTQEEITIWFDCASPAKAQKQLAKFKNIEYDKEENEYLFLEEDNTTSSGNCKVLGKFFFDRKEIIAGVCSRQSRKKLISLLTSIPGVDYTEDSMDDSNHGLPYLEDDDFDSDQSPDMNSPVSGIPAFAQRYLDDYYKKWLDTPLPALNNLSPRQAAKNKKDKKKVKLLIESIPCIPGNMKTKPPVQELLRELDLDE